MNAIQTMQQELNKIHQAQAACISEEGHVLSCYRYKYQLLTQQARAFKESIEWLEILSTDGKEVTPCP